MYRLYEYPPSGNSYKVLMALRELGVPFEQVSVDILKGETRTPEFLAKNANGRIPVLELDDGRTLAESGAILMYLAATSHGEKGTELLPADPWDRAKVLEWMFFEQYSHEPNIAVARFWQHSLHQTPEELGEKLEEKLKGGYAALDVMEAGLAGRDWLVAGRFTIADIALYAYTHVAHEGGFSLEAYPNIRAWIARIEARPGYQPMAEAWPCPSKDAGWSPHPPPSPRA